MGDYLRSGGGLVFALIALALVPFPGTPGWLLIGLVALCLGLAARAALRQLTVIEVTDETLRRGYPHLPLGGTTLRWDGLDVLRLKFFPTGRDRSKGWMQLVMRGGGARIAVDSTVDGFDTVAEAAVRAAEDRGLALGITTLENLAALGIHVDPATAD